jgi:hypothetical protein
MWNRIRVKAQLANLFPGVAVVGGIDSIGQQEFRLALQRVSFDGDNDRAAFSSLCRSHVFSTIRSMLDYTT